LVLTLVIGYSLSKEREHRISENPHGIESLMRPAYFLGIAVVIQLFLGALMRHTGSGLAIPDFPTIGGGWLPVFDAAFMDRINEFMFENGFDMVSLGQVWIHYGHRLGAVSVFLFTALFLFKMYKSNETQLLSTGMMLVFVVLVQITLGASVIWTVRNPLITSLHVVTGAGYLALVTLTILRLRPISS
jgi:cytochrome c oxidase assembly protein subunit 15